MKLKKMYNAVSTMRLSFSQILGIVGLTLAHISLSCVSTRGSADASMVDADLLKQMRRHHLITSLQEEIEQNKTNIQLTAKNHLAIIALGQEELQSFEQDTIRSIRALNEIVSNLVYTVISLPANGYVGQRYTDALLIRVLSADYPLAGTEIMVQELLEEADGTQIATDFVVTTDENGYASIHLATPRATGTHRIIVGINSKSFLEPVLSEDTEIVNLSIDATTKKQLEDVLSAEETLIRIGVESFADQYSMDVYVQDTDISDAIIQGENTATGIVQTLSERGFIVTALLLPEETEKLRLARALAISNADRVAFGEAKILQFEESAGGFSVELNALVRVYDRTTQKTLLTVQRRQRSSGTNFSSTVVAAFRILGTKVAEELQKGLP